MGALEVIDGDGRTVAVGGERVRLLLTALLLERGRVVPADRLVDLLWGDQPPRQPAGALQTLVSRLRRCLPDHAVASRGGGYALDADAVDAADFERLVIDARDAGDPAKALPAYDAALALWRGDPYHEVLDWESAQAEAARLGELQAAAREERAAALLNLGRASEAVATLEALTVEHPLRERPRELLMRALYRAGRHPEALRVYDAYRRLLADELGLEPSPALRRVQDEVLLHELPEPPARPDAEPPLRSGTEPPLRSGTEPEPGTEPARRAAADGLPVEVTAIVGREGDVDALSDLIGRKRLVTLLGPGGVGKTRLAVHAAHRAVTPFGHGAGASFDDAWFCDLSVVTTGAAVAQAVALAVGAAGEGAPPEELLETRLGRGRNLVVLDNCEHLLDAIASLAERIVRLGTTVILATSRERLALDGEHVYVVSPLPVDSARGSPAVELFAERASAVRDDFVLDETNAPVVARICKRLDGLPLAIELAAARLRALELADVERGLDERFRLLAAGRRTAAARQRSLRGAIDWSYSLLDDVEKEVFDHLSVFAGGFDASAAAAVLGRPPAETLDDVCQLVERSLVAERPGARGARFFLLDTLRAYGGERLRERDRYDVGLDRHADYYVAFAQSAAVGMRGRDEAEWVERIELELADLRVAQQRLLARDVDGALRLACALVWYGWSRMRPEVLLWAEQAVVQFEAAEHILRPVALGAAALGAWKRGDLARARHQAEQAVEIAGDTGGARQALEVLGDVALVEGRLAEAIAAYRRAQASARVYDDGAALSLNLGNEAIAHAYGDDVGVAVEVAGEALAVARQTENPTALSWAYYTLGEAQLDADPAAARVSLEEALRIGERDGIRFVLGVAGLSAASLEARHGDPSTAARRYHDLVTGWRGAGVVTPQWPTLRNVAALLAAQGDAATAAVLWGAVTGHPAASPAFGADAARLEQLAAELRRALGDADFERNAARGRATSVGEVVDVAAAGLTEVR